MFARNESRFFAASHAVKARTFFAKHGPKAVLLARFVPIVRTFTPVVAGVARMPRGAFTAYNAQGGIVWILGFLAVGYFLGGIPIISAHVELFAIGMVVLSLLPGAIGVVRHRYRSSGQAGAVSNPTSSPSTTSVGS